MEEAREVKRNLKRKKDKNDYSPAQIVKKQSMQGFYFEGVYRRTSNGDCKLYHRKQRDCKADSEGIWD